MSLFDTFNGKLILLAAAIVFFGAVQSHDVNKFIEKVNEENSSDYRKPRLQTAYCYSLVFAGVILLAALFIPV